MRQPTISSRSVRLNYLIERGGGKKKRKRKGEESGERWVMKRELQFFFTYLRPPYLRPTHFEINRVSPRTTVPDIKALYIISLPLPSSSLATKPNACPPPSEKLFHPKSRRIYELRSPGVPWLWAGYIVVKRRPIFLPPE